MGNKANKEIQQIQPEQYIDTNVSKSLFISERLFAFMGDQQSLYLVFAYCSQTQQTTKLFIPNDIIHIIFAFMFEINTEKAILITLNPDKDKPNSNINTFKYEYIKKGDKKRVIHYHFVKHIPETITYTKRPSMKHKIASKFRKSFTSQTQNVNVSNTDTKTKHTWSSSEIDQLCAKYNHKPIEQIKYKMLILGACMTGKSAILKQLRQLYGRNF